MAMDSLFFVLFITLAVVLLIVSKFVNRETNETKVLKTFSGFLFLAIGVSLAAGVAYACGSATNNTYANYSGFNDVNICSNGTINTTNDGCTNVASIFSEQHEFTTTPSVNASMSTNSYCTWKWNTDASNGVTMNTLFSIVLIFMGLLIVLSAWVFDN